MRPLQVEIVHVDVVGLVAFADDVFRKVEIQAAPVFVPLDIPRSEARLPRSQRVETALDGHVHVVVECEIVPGVPQEKALYGLLAPGRHDETGVASAHRRKEAERQSEEIDRHVFHHQVRRADDHLLARNGLGLGHCQVEVRVIQVAGGVFAVGDVDRVVGHFLDARAFQVAFSVLRRHAFDTGLFGGDVVGDRVHLVGRSSVGEFGPGVRLGGRIFASVGEDDLVVHVDFHEVRLQVFILVVDVAFLVDVDRFVTKIVNQRILVFPRNYVVEERFALRGVFLGSVPRGDGRTVGRRILRRRGRIQSGDGVCGRVLDRRVFRQRIASCGILQKGFVRRGRISPLAAENKLSKRDQT